MSGCLTLLSANVEVQIGFCVIAENAEVAASIGGFAAAVVVIVLVAVLIDLDTAAAALVAVSIVPEDADMIVLDTAAAVLVAVSIVLDTAAAALVAVLFVLEGAETIVLVVAVAVSIALEIAFEHLAPFEPLLHHLKTWFRRKCQPYPPKTTANVSNDWPRCVPKI